MNDLKREYKRSMLRSTFQSLFWCVLLARKQQWRFTLTALADKLGINKSYLSRSFSNPPNWQIDKMADMADALGVDLVIQAQDKVTGVIYTAFGVVSTSATTESGSGLDQGSQPRSQSTVISFEDGTKLVRAGAA